MLGAVDVLLDGASGLAELGFAAAALYEALAAPVMDLLAAGHEGTRLAEGLALSPRLAGECVRDAVRTAMLLRGVYAALGEALRRFAGEIVEVVYAGTGPLAPLVIPLLPRFAEAPVAFTFVDVHEEAVRASRIVAEHFGVAGAVWAFVTADATRYLHSSPIHLLIIETMQQALTREPQVAIVRHLARQLAPGGLMVPESVRVDLVVPHSLPQCLLDLRTDVADLPLDEEGCLPAVAVRLPEQTLPPEAQPMYFTEIVAFGEHVIEPYQSGLTHPRIAWELLSLEPGCELEFRYQLGPEPRFRWAVR
jgi:hypothetical protein